MYKNTSYKGEIKMNTRERVLKEALNCVNGEREKQYGNPEDNFSRIADLWSVYLTSLFEDEKIVVDIDPIDVAKMMILFKIARSNGDKDKLDNYIDILGYGACAAEIFESSEKAEQVRKKKEELGVQLADECKDCDYAEKCIGTGVCLKETEKKCIKDKPDDKCNRNECGQFDSCMTAYQHYIYNKTKEASEAIDKCMCEQKNPYSYFHDRLANYVSVKAKEALIPLDKLKEINRKFPRELEEFLDQAANDCVINGKKLLDCYKEIDELFKKYVKLSPYRVKNTVDKKYSASLFDVYNSISADILSFSTSANVDPFDIVGRLTTNGHAPMDMASLVLTGRLNIDCVVHYIEDAIHEVKNGYKPKDMRVQVEGGRIYFNSKVTDNNKDVYRNAFNEAAEQMIQNLKDDKKITRAVEVPEGFDVYSIYMTEAGQIIARFNPVKENKK